MSERVTFYSEGLKLIGKLHKPGDATEPYPVVIQGPGWLESACSPTSEPFHEGLVEGGYAVLQFDSRGFGESEGERGWVRPQQQVEDTLSAITYARTRRDLDAKGIGLFGLGGTGGGNAIYAAAHSPHVRCVVVQTVVADGRDWLRRMRREHEWLEFERRVDANSLGRVLNNEDQLVEPREELMVATPERRADTARTADDRQVGSGFHLASAEHLLRYRPLDVVDRIAPRALLIACVEHDAVTPEDHAIALYERAGLPKKLIRQTGVTHYLSYRQNYAALMTQFRDWYDRHLKAPGREASRTLTQEVSEISSPS